MSEPASNPVEPTRKHRILELDGLRAVSVVLVIVYHCWLYSKTIYIPDGLNWFIDYIGPVGVKVFFVISGFIITRLMLEEVAATGRFSARVFFIKRVFRIIPAYWAYLSAVTFLASLGVIAADLRNMVPSLFFTSDFLMYGSTLAFFFGHSWSLAVEEQFYLLFPLMVALLMRKGVRFTSILLISIYVIVLFSPNVGKIVRVHFDTIDIAFLTHFRYIIDGVLLTLWWDKFGDWMRRTNWLFPVAAVAGLLAMAYIQSTSASYVFYAKYFFMLVEPIVITLLLGWILQHPVHFSLLRWPITQWLGRISYSVYLWQQLFTGEAGLYLAVPKPGLLTSTILILVCASLSYYLIELPFNAIGRKFLKKKKPAASNAPTVELSNS